MPATASVIRITWPAPPPARSFVASTMTGATRTVIAVKEGGRRPNEAVKLGAILDAQQSILTVLGRISDRLDKIDSRLAEHNRKTSP